MRLMVVIVLALLAAALIVSAASAFPVAGNETVAQWRQWIQGNERAATIYAAGAVSAQNLTWTCASPLSVGEWAAFLRFGADPNLTMRQAMLVQLQRLGCEISADALLESIGKPAPKADDAHYH